LYGFFVLPESNQNRSRFSFAKANPFSALIGLAQIHGIGNLVAVFTLVALPEFILRTTWVLYTTFRFRWGPTENGISLFIVGIASALGQTILLRTMLKNFGDVRTLLVGLTSSFFAYILYGLSTQGWMMYVVICANMLGFVVAPALQGLVSKAVDPAKQGLAIGSLNSINSIMGVIAPLFATPILASVSHYPPTDLRVGTTFFLAALFQFSALALAIRHFRKEPVTVAIAPPHAG
jgi:DHA1 family tetracycline resistance protein-like MFS transporter